MSKLNAQPGFRFDLAAQVIQSAYLAKQELTITPQATSSQFIPLTEAEIGQEVFLVIETENMYGALLEVQLLQPYTEDLTEQARLLDTYRIKVGGFARAYKNAAIAKITLPSDLALFEITDEGSIPIYIKVSTDSEVLDSFQASYSESETPNVWYYGTDQWFRLIQKQKTKVAPLDYRFKCTRYGSKYGPVFWGTLPLADYPFWDALIAEGKVTHDEKEILIAMSENEGKLNSVHSYDSEIFTAGAMQKTVNSKGMGEFPIQVQEFKASHPHKYKTLFEAYGWIVEDAMLFYKDPSTPDAPLVTGSALKSLIREGFTQRTYRDELPCIPLAPIVNALNDPDFQAKQVTDFIYRLRKKVLQLKPSGHHHPLRDYVKSKLGRALVLDQHINRPGYVRVDFAKALNTFYNRMDNEVIMHNSKLKDRSKMKTKVPRNPKNWGAQHSVYEEMVISYYGLHRRGTDMKNRYLRIEHKF